MYFTKLGYTNILTVSFSHSVKTHLDVLVAVVFSVLTSWGTNITNTQCNCIQFCSNAKASCISSICLLSVWSPDYIWLTTHQETPTRQGFLIEFHNPCVTAHTLAWEKRAVLEEELKADKSWRFAKQGLHTWFIWDAVGPGGAISLHAIQSSIHAEVWFAAGLKLNLVLYSPGNFNIDGVPLYMANYTKLLTGRETHKQNPVPTIDMGIKLEVPYVHTVKSSTELLPGSFLKWRV